MKIKIHKGTRYIVAICDSDLLGKKFEESNGKSNITMQVDLTGEFFNGNEKNEKEVREIIKDMQQEDACFNIVGKKSVDLCKKIGLVSDEGIVEVKGVPIALVLM